MAGKGNINLAIAHFQRAGRLNPNDADIQNDLGLALLQVGKIDQAIDHLKRAVAISPASHDFNYTLAFAFEKCGELDSTIAYLKKEVEINPGFESARQTLAAALSRRERVVNAVNDLRNRLAKSPKDHGLLAAAAWILATTPYASIRNGTDAVMLAERAWKLTGGDDSRILYALAAAYAEAGRFHEAVAAARRGLKIANAADDQQLAEQISRCLALYEAGKPFRDIPR